MLGFQGFRVIIRVQDNLCNDAEGPYLSFQECQNDLLLAMFLNASGKLRCLSVFVLVVT